MLITSLLEQRSQNGILSQTIKYIRYIARTKNIQLILRVLNCLLGNTNKVEYMKDINKKLNGRADFGDKQTDRTGAREAHEARETQAARQKKELKQTDNDILYSTQRGGREEGGGRHKWGENKENMILKPNQENKVKTMAQSGLEVSHTGA